MNRTAFAYRPQDDERAPFGGDATHLAQCIVRGELSARQALERCVDAVRDRNPRVHAVCLLDADVAERSAAALDAELAVCADDAARAALLGRRPFFGVPLLLKDLGAAARDLPSRFGSRLGASFGPQGLRWPRDSTLVARYRSAGFVPFGRTTSPEMGLSPSTEAVVYGAPTRNPWNAAHSAGGSSGGAAAALASGMVPIAHANDGAGSIRIPAACCGLVGLKPSRGLMPMGPYAGEGWGGLAVEHMLTLTVRDCAAALDASAGADPGAPYAAPPRPPSFRGAIDATAQAPRRRVALCDHTFDGDPVQPEVADAVDRFARRLEALGHRVERAVPPLDTLELLTPMMHVVACGAAQAVQALLEQRGRPLGSDELEPATRSAWELGLHTSGARYLQHLADLHALARRVAAFFERFDLLLTPVLAETPARLGRLVMRNPDFLDYRLGPSGVWRYSPFTPLANVTGGASISLPAGLSSSGLPIGALLTTGLGGDAMLLQVAAEIEAIHRCVGGDTGSDRP